MTTIKIKYPKKRHPKVYEIKIDKLLFILSELEKRKIDFKNNNQIEKLLKKYRLYDKMFLENISGL